MSNLEIRTFSQSIKNFINESPLPAEVKRLALVPIMSELEVEANNAISAEIMARNKNEQEAAQKEEEVKKYEYE